jgi:hypothetical protein
MSNRQPATKRLASTVFQEETKTVAPPRRVFPPPPECVIISQSELTNICGSDYVLVEMGLRNMDYAHLLNDEVHFFIKLLPRTEPNDDYYILSGTAVSFEDKDGTRRNLRNRINVATRVTLLRLAGRQRYRTAVMQSLCVGLHSPNSSISRAFNSDLGETNLFRCIMDF